MNNVVASQEKNMVAIESALVKNDISGLSTQERLTLYNKICESVGLNPLTKPFAYLKLQGREVLYATKDATEQLRKIHGVSTQIISKGVIGDLYEVHVKARDKSGKEDDDLAYVVVKGLTGVDLVNAMLKCVTKAKRRVTLSICGLGVLDESEISTIAEEVIRPADNPQVVNPLKDVKQIEPAKEPELPKIEDLGKFVIKVGVKHKGKTLENMDQFELSNFLNWAMEQQKKPDNKISGPAWTEFIEHAEEYLMRSEKRRMDSEEVPY